MQIPSGEFFPLLVGAAGGDVGERREQPFSFDPSSLSNDEKATKIELQTFFLVPFRKHQYPRRLDLIPNRSKSKFFEASGTNGARAYTC